MLEVIHIAMSTPKNKGKLETLLRLAEIAKESGRMEAYDIYNEAANEARKQLSND
jgi:hypothetical protein